MDSTKNEANNLGEKIVVVLKTIFDPEIPVDIYELGLIYDVFVNEDNDVKILMTLTSPNCPVAETLPVEVEEKVKSLDEVKDVQQGYECGVTIQEFSDVQDGDIIETFQIKKELRKL